eukprot:1139803-Pelagomonas_calceolata.AAC.5
MASETKVCAGACAGLMALDIGLSGERDLCTDSQLMTCTHECRSTNTHAPQAQGCLRSCWAWWLAPPGGPHPGQMDAQACMRVRHRHKPASSPTMPVSQQKSRVPIMPASQHNSEHEPASLPIMPVSLHTSECCAPPQPLHHPHLLTPTFPIPQATASNITDTSECCAPSHHHFLLALSHCANGKLVADHEQGLHGAILFHRHCQTWRLKAGLCV